MITFSYILLLLHISSIFKPEASFVTTRAHIHYVVKENVTINLYGKTSEERAELLIQIAHPDDREALSKSAFNLYK